LQTPEKGISPLRDVGLVREKEDDVIGSLGAVEDGVEISSGRNEELEGGFETRSAEETETEARTKSARGISYV